MWAKISRLTVLYRLMVWGAIVYSCTTLRIGFYGAELEQGVDGLGIKNILDKCKKAEWVPKNDF